MRLSLICLKMAIGLNAVMPTFASAQEEYYDQPTEQFGSCATPRKGTYNVRVDDLDKYDAVGRRLPPGAEMGLCTVNGRVIIQVGVFSCKCNAQGFAARLRREIYRSRDTQLITLFPTR